jgi:hypothetical protein
MVAIAGVAAAMTAALSPAAFSGQSPFRVTTILGQGEMRRAGAAWTPARLKADLGPGDDARTLHGRLTLRSASGQEVRLASASHVTLLEMSAGDEPTRVRLLGGAAWVAVLPAAPPSEHIELQVGPIACTVKTGGVGMLLERDGSALVRVYHGTAECVGTPSVGRWTRNLTDAKEMRVANTGAQPEVRALAREKIEADWLKWNEGQDAAGGYGGKPPGR